MKQFKKATAILLALCLMLSVWTIVPTFATEAPAESVGASSGTTGDCTWTLDDDGNLTISGNGVMEDNYSPWGTDIKRVIIENGVTSIGVKAFAYCRSLTSVTIPDSVKSIGRYAFENCSSLTSVTIGNSVTSIGYEAFKDTGYYNDDSNWENDVLYIGRYLIKAKDSLSGAYEIKNNILCIADDAFAYCTSLTNVNIPGSVTSIGYSAFISCKGLTSVNIPDSVTSIGEGAFINCSSLTQIDVDSANPSYSSQDGVLFDKKKTNLIKYPAGKTDLSYVIPDSVTNIGKYAFDDCSSLTNVMIPDSVISIGYKAFYYCESLTSVRIGKNVTSIGDTTFAYCNSLTSVTIPDSVTSIGIQAFWNCSNLTSVTIGKSVTNIGISAFEETGYYNDDSNWENGVLYIGKYLIEAKKTLSGNYEVRNDTLCIADYAFNHCTGLTSIKIPSSMISIGESAFSLCENLTGVIIPDSVTSIGLCAFGNCKSLTSVTLGKSVTSIGSEAFLNCQALKNVTIYSKQVNSIGENALGYTLSFYYEDNYDYDYNKGVFGGGTPVYALVSDFTITSYRQTVQEKYAADNNIKFIYLDEPVPTEEPTEATDSTEPTEVPEPTDSDVTEPTEPPVEEPSEPTEPTEQPAEEPTEPTEPEPTEPQTPDEPIEEITIGDLSGDGKVDAKDRIMLTRYLAHWAGYETIDEQAADLNKDGKVDAKDRIILTRHLAKWQGYETL